MKLGIVTDTHDNKPAILRAVDLFNSRAVDLVIHAGDMVAPFSAALFKNLKAPLKFHFGNNDGEILLLRERLLEIGAEVHKYDFEFELDGKRFLVQHEPVNLEAIAASGRHDAIIYGHTHDLDVRPPEEGRPLIINPGEACSWLRGLANAALLETETMQVEIVKLL
jgi:putative phosphoesterase